MGVPAPGPTVCCACMHEAQSRRRQRVLSHTLLRTDPAKSCAVTVRCMTLALELNVIIGAPLVGLRTWPDGPALPRPPAPAQTAGAHSDLAVVAPDFEQVVESRRGFRAGINRRPKRSRSSDIHGT